MKLKSIRYSERFSTDVSCCRSYGCRCSSRSRSRREGFLVKSFSPQGQVTGRAEIKAVFNRAVVAADKVGISLTAAEMPFLFLPLFPAAASG